MCVCVEKLRIPQAEGLICDPESENFDFFVRQERTQDVLHLSPSTSRHLYPYLSIVLRFRPATLSGKVGRVMLLSLCHVETLRGSQRSSGPLRPSGQQKHVPTAKKQHVDVRKTEIQRTKSICSEFKTNIKSEKTKDPDGLSFLKGDWC